MTTPQRYDVVILGTGPAGLQAAIHAARKKVSVIVLGKENKSSLFHAHIENFCCLFNVAGEEMLANGRKQAASFGAHFSEDDVLAINAREDGLALETESGATLITPALIIATGTHRNRLGVKGEKELIGRGVSYCVDCDGHFYKGEAVAVVGSESAAVDGALTLLEIGAKEVHLVCERLDVSQALKAKLETSQVKVHLGAKAGAIQGANQVEGLALSDGSVIPVGGVFIEQGAKGLLQLATNLGIMLDDEMRYIQTDKRQATNMPGIYAAGDVCGPPWQMAKAVGEGCVAGINAADYAKKRKQ
ncbi:MAG: NAD(P)/FAD-dependent oxidoreductase [Desulfobacterales bacterium]|nr:NAD(P)/FAD-dependent oxidoreductase [Desulfobacterales bacterium]